jgi:hypothetical protein
MNLSLFIQGLIAAILIGLFYNVWASTKAYGGLIGKAIRFFGLGMLFITVAVLERILMNFDVIQTSANLSLVQDAFTLIGLLFLASGFSKLASIAKTP